ncbi:MAG: class IIb bacteriocin, lactobin A/cerein 7B family [Gammaproteobacteria bacterium]|nr:class IIb bacteriocin, lactobin A/cerein 7B family [Gammaproteobacteria bacterium]
MRELTVEEMEQVDGGIGVFGAVTGAAAGAIGAAVTGGGFREIGTGAALAF